MAKTERTFKRKPAKAGAPEQAPAQVPAVVDYRARAKAVVEEHREKFMEQVNKVKALLIVDQASMNSAGALKTEAGTLFKMLDEKRDALVRPMNEDVKFINDLFRPFLNGLESAKEDLARKMKAYLAESARRRQAEEAKAREEARRKELELKRATLEQAFEPALQGLKWKAELAPMDETMEKYLEVAMYQLSQAYAPPDPRKWVKQYLASIEVPYLDELELSKAPPPAEVVQAQAQAQGASEIVVPAVSVVPDVKKPAGTYLRDNYRFRYVDENGEPVNAPRLDLIPMEYHQVNEQMLRAIATSSKGMATVKGVEFYAE